MNTIDLYIIHSANATIIREGMRKISLGKYLPESL